MLGEAAGAFRTERRQLEGEITERRIRLDGQQLLQLHRVQQFFHHAKRQAQLVAHLAPRSQP